MRCLSLGRRPRARSSFGQHSGQLAPVGGRPVQVGRGVEPGRSLGRRLRPQLRRRRSPTSVARPRRRATGVPPTPENTRRALLTRPSGPRPITVATPTMAKSPLRRLNSWNAHPVDAGHGGKPDRGQQLVGFERRGEKALGEGFGGDGPRPSGALGLDLAVESDHDRRQLGGRIGVGDASADGPPVADGGMADEAERGGQQGLPRCTTAERSAVR